MEDWSPNDSKTKKILQHVEPLTDLIDSRTADLKVRAAQRKKPTPRGSGRKKI